MAVPASLTYASEVIGFISFCFTLLTALGVYSELIKTLRGAPSIIPLALGNLREELKYELLLCKQGLSHHDAFHVLPLTRRPGKRSRHDFGRLLEHTLHHLWREFVDVERRFLVEGEKVSENIDSDNNEDHNDVDEKGRRRRGARPNPTAAARQSYIRSRMGWIEAGLARDRQTYYNTDFAHRFLWWWKKDDVNNLAQQLQRLQIRRIERDAYESNILVKRGLKIYGRFSGDDIYDNTDDGDDESSDGGRGGSGDDRGGGGGGGGATRSGHRRRHSGVSSARVHGRRKGRNGTAVHGAVREVSEKEIVRRRAPSPDDPPSPPRRPASVAASRQARPGRASVVYEYEVVDPGRTHVEYVDPGQDQRWQEGRQRSYSRSNNRGFVDDRL